MTIQVKIVADSIYGCDRLTTIVATYPRFIHAELLTHRVFSRNAASSRAIPIAKMMQAVKEDTAMPEVWGKNQPGMQAGNEVDGDTRYMCKEVWWKARDQALELADKLDRFGIHKQIVNRILEPFAHITTIITATEWEGFLKQRAHPAAQPEMQLLAKAIENELRNNEPTRVAEGTWHLPFINDSDVGTIDELKDMSVARCARVSYLNHDGSAPDRKKDLELTHKLLSAEPPHASPFEHVATPCRYQHEWTNFKGWKQYRKQLGL